jgi:hypothetical protein
MTLRIGVLPHADLPHILPSFRICRELLKSGHEVSVLGSDDHKIGRGHSEAWAEQLGAFGLGGRQAVHVGSDASFADWLAQQASERGFDMLILDAVWQGLAFSCHAPIVKNVVIHHAGLPDFRSRDMPTWYFVHPRHTRDVWQLARTINDRKEQAGQGVRGLLTSIKALSDQGKKAQGVFEFGCGEFETVPATRAMSLCPAVEYPDERGRLRYFGTLLPKPHDIDWRPLPPEMTDAHQSLIACVFGTTGLQTREEYQWLVAVGKQLAHYFVECQIVVVAPENMRRELNLDRRPRNLRLYPWIPLWEVLSNRMGAKVVVTTSGVGTLREAIASGTPIVAIPRKLDQFGAAARVEYFGVGSAIVSRELPQPELVVKHVAIALEDSAVHARTRDLQNEVIAFDSTQPLKRFIDDISVGRGAS